MAKCIMCGRKPGDVVDGGKRIVKLVNGRYGKLCQECNQNTGNQPTASQKRKTKRRLEYEEAANRSGQMTMFEDIDNEQ